MADATAVKLRPLEERDIATVAAFECEIAKISFPDDPITDLEFYARKLRQLLGDRRSVGFVTEDGQGITGWVHVSRRQNFTTKEAYADIHSVYVVDRARGTGLANAIMDAVIERCHRDGLDRIVIRTRATNEPMKALLARCGFTATQIYYELDTGAGD